MSAATVGDNNELNRHGSDNERAGAPWATGQEIRPRSMPDGSTTSCVATACCRVPRSAASRPPISASASASWPRCRASRSATTRPEAGAPASIISKFPTADPVNLGVARMLSFYPREVAFYTKLAQHSPIRTPRLLHADLDMSDHSFVLLLEDMGGATLGDQIAGLTPAAGRGGDNGHRAPARRLVGQGRLRRHGCAVRFCQSPVWRGRARRATRASWRRRLSDFADCYSDYTKKTAEGLAPVAARVIKDLSSSGARTFLHGDYRADNLLFGPGLGDDGIAAVDWQISGRGGAAVRRRLPDLQQRPDRVPAAGRKDPAAPLPRHPAAAWASKASASTIAGRPTASPSCAACSSPYSRPAAWASAISVARRWCAPSVRRVDAAVSELQVGDLLPA